MKIEIIVNPCIFVSLNSPNCKKVGTKSLSQYSFQKVSCGVYLNLVISIQGKADKHDLKLLTWQQDYVLDLFLAREQ